MLRCTSCFRGSTAHRPDAPVMGTHKNMHKCASRVFQVSCTVVAQLCLLSLHIARPAAVFRSSFSCRCSFDFLAAMSFAPEGHSNALQELLNSFQVPETLCAALLEKGLASVPDFAYAFAKATELDCFCSEDYAQLWHKTCRLTTPCTALPWRDCVGHMSGPGRLPG